MSTPRDAGAARILLAAPSPPTVPSRAPPTAPSLALPTAPSPSSTPSPEPSPPPLAHALPAIYAAAGLRLMLPLLVLPMMAVRVGIEEFGRLSFILVWSGLIAMLVEGGFLAAATRLAVAGDAPRRWQLAQQVFTARCALCLPAVLLAAAAVRWAEPSGSGGHGPIDALAIAGLACALGWPATWYLQATDQLGRWARVELVVWALMLLGCWAGAHSVEAYLGLQFVATGALAAIGWCWLRRDLEVQIDPARPGRRDGADPVPPTHRPLPLPRPQLRLWSPAQLRPGLALGWTMLPVSIAGAAYSFALPAAASSQLSKADLGIYFMADRLVRALLAAADPVFSVVYPRIVARFAVGSRAALAYAGRWAVAGCGAGLALLLAGALLWPLLTAQAPQRLTGLDPIRLAAVLQVLGLLLPLLLGWKFIGYWMLGSRRFDTAYRSCVVAGGVVGTLAALTIGGASGAVGLAWTSLSVEVMVIALAIIGVAATRRHHRRRGA